MGSKSRRYLPVLLALTASVIVAAAVAVPLMQLTVQQIGAGYADVLSPVNNARVSHVFKIQGSGIYIDAVKMVFDKDLPAGSYIRVELRDANDVVLASGEVVLNNNLPAGQSITVDTNPNLGFYDILRYSKIVVVVTGTDVQT